MTKKELELRIVMLEAQVATLTALVAVQAPAPVTPWYQPYQFPYTITYASSLTADPGLVGIN